MHKVSENQCIRFNTRVGGVREKIRHQIWAHLRIAVRSQRLPCLLLPAGFLADANQSPASDFGS